MPQERDLQFKFDAVCVLAAAAKNKKTLWLANLTAEPQHVAIKGLSEAVVVNRIDAFNFTQLSNSPGCLNSTGERARSARGLARRVYGLTRPMSA